jgi:transposase-like protein
MPRGGRGTVYKPEFKQMAVELVLSSNKTIKQVADELNINDATLTYWLKQHRKTINTSQSAGQQTYTSKSSINTAANTNTELSEENKQLKKENARLKMECEILKKATAYFAKTAL